MCVMVDWWKLINNNYWKECVHQPKSDFFCDILKTIFERNKKINKIDEMLKLKKFVKESVKRL